MISVSTREFKAITKNSQWDKLENVKPELTRRNKVFQKYRTWFLLKLNIKFTLSFKGAKESQILLTDKKQCCSGKEKVFSS
jgi:hypothetical protein